MAQPSNLSSQEPSPPLSTVAASSSASTEAKKYEKQAEFLMNHILEMRFRGGVFKMMQEADPLKRAELIKRICPLVEKYQEENSLLLATIATNNEHTPRQIRAQIARWDTPLANEIQREIQAAIDKKEIPNMNLKNRADWFY